MRFNLPAASQRLVACADASLADSIAIALQIVARVVLADTETVAAEVDPVPRSREDFLIVRVGTQVGLRHQYV